jgi:serine/threonine-protein kinase
MNAPNLAAGLPPLGKYELLEEIGHGGMATVYRARDPRLGREVAVKVIHKHLRENAEVATRFVAEARAAAKLRHPGIVEVFDVSGPDDDERFLVVELLRGTTLRKILQRHRDMPAEVGASIVLSLCEALEHAHTAGIIHRDIKPENVLVEQPGDRAPPRPSLRGAVGPAEGAAAKLADAVEVSEAPAGGPARDEARARNAARGPDGGADDVVDSEPPERSGLTTRSTDGAVSAATARHGAVDPSEARGGAQVPESAAKPPSASAAAASSSINKRGDLGVVIKITDFGIAKVLDQQGVTSTGQVLGSPAHMAPEQIEGGDVDARTDVFALGVLMYECLVGHLPFEGKNPAQVLRRVLEGVYPAADRERPTVGGRWSRILDAALARTADQRTASPAALGEQIQAELDALGVGNPRAEIAAYFSDPAGYTAELTRRLVPRLVARGEQARKAGDIQGAAADYNRALALAPDDLTILKRIGSLTSSQSRRLLARRAAMVLGASLVLGVAAFGVARFLKTRANGGEGPADPALTGSARATPSVTADPPRAPSSADPIRPPSDTTADAVRSAAPKIPPPTWTSGAPAPRKVRFSIIPKGAKLTLDGQEVAWFSNVFSLAPGQHSVRVQVPGSKCCKPYTGSYGVTPAPKDKPDEVQPIVIKLETLPATVSLTGAPPNGQYSCPSLGLSGFAGGSKQIALSDVVWVGRCEFKSPAAGSQLKTATITLKAGESNTIVWP